MYMTDPEFHSWGRHVWIQGCKASKIVRGSLQAISCHFWLNIFLREKLKEQGQVCPEQYQALSKKYSKEWSTLSREDQSMYRLQAQYETEMRSQVKELPLAAKDQPDPTLEN